MSRPKRAKPNASVLTNIVASITCFLLASVCWPLSMWLLSASWKTRWPWGAAMLPLIIVVAIFAVGSTAGIFTVWQDDGAEEEDQ